MTRPKTLLGELVGLFVDDGSLAVAIVAAVAIGALVLPRLPVDEVVRPVVLLLVVLLVLVDNIIRSVRAVRRQ